MFRKKPSQSHLFIYPSYRRSHTLAVKQPLIRIPKQSAVYAFGAANKHSKPLFETGNDDWTIHKEESWAIVGKGTSKVFQTLLGHARISPVPSEGLYPSLKGVDPFSCLKFVAFRHSGALGGAGGFYDYTAKYGAMRDGDGKTLNETFEGALEESLLTHSERTNILYHLGLTELLPIPLIALSNGQMRRARIAKALFKSPKILLLDEPLTGLDVLSRDRLIRLLHSFKLSPSSPHVISSFRLQEIVDLKAPALPDIAPEYISHILYVEGDVFWAGPRDAFFRDFARRHFGEVPDDSRQPHYLPSPQVQSHTVVDLQNVNVRYGERTVLKDINWKIRQGDRWHLQGANGSGKTTLLSLLTGDHPQSYTQQHLLLPTLIPSSSSEHHSHPRHQPHWQLQNRKRTPTAYLSSLIGIISPELFDAFPRRHPGMSVWDAVQTGFTGGFVPANTKVGEVHVDSWEHNADQLRRWRTERCWDVLEGLGPVAWGINVLGGTEASKSAATREFATRSFTSLASGEQRLVLLMRALVGRPPLVILDEVWSGMDERMIRAVKAYFDGGAGLDSNQAVVLITHWEDEVPWMKSGGLKQFRLEDGDGRIV